MESKVADNWLAFRKRGVFEQIRDRIVSSPRPSMRSRIANARHRLTLQANKLDSNVSRLTERDKKMFDKCVKARMSKDAPRATMYANECAEIRKVTKVVIRSQLALEQVSLRLETVEDLGNILVNMAPVVGVIRETKGSLTGVLPEVASELGYVNQMLSNTVLEAGGLSDRDMSIEATEEAQKIIQEANLVAEQRIREHFPELPAALPTLPDDLQRTAEQGK